MRILLLAPFLGTGGAEKHLAVLGAGLHARGHDARVVALNAGGHRVGELTGAGVPVEVLGMHGPTDLRPALASPTLRRFAPAAILSAGVNGLYLGALLARRHRAAHVYNEHRGAGVELSARRRTMMRLMARSLDGVIVVSPDQRPDWLAHGLAPERLHVIPNGVAADAPPEVRAEVRAALGVAPEAVLALTVATLRPLKRVADFLAAMRVARRTVPELVGLVAGDGPERASLAAQADATSGVRLLGLRDDVARLLRAADLLVLPSDREALPMAVLEAMASGVPVVATRVGAVPELLGDGESGVLFDPGDVAALSAALVALARDPERRASMGAAAQRRVAAGWSAETMVERYERTLQEALRR